MEELEKKYDDAIDTVEKDLLKKLKPDQIYELYGLHKVYVAGPNRVSRPGPFARQSKIKAWSSWLKHSHLTKKQCMLKYIKLVNDFLKQNPMKII